MQMVADDHARNFVHEVGQRIKHYREVRGLEQGDLAQAIDRSQAVVSRAESGEVPPSLDVVQRIARALGVPIHRLLWGEEATRAEPLAKILEALYPLPEPEQREAVHRIILVLEGKYPPGTWGYQLCQELRVLIGLKPHPFDDGDNDTSGATSAA